MSDVSILMPDRVDMGRSALKSISGHLGTGFDCKKHRQPPLARHADMLSAHLFIFKMYDGASSRMRKKRQEPMRWPAAAGILSRAIFSNAADQMKPSSMTSDDTFRRCLGDARYIF